MTVKDPRPLWKRIVETEVSVHCEFTGLSIKNLYLAAMYLIWEAWLKFEMLFWSKKRKEAYRTLTSDIAASIGSTNITPNTFTEDKTNES